MAGWSIPAWLGWYAFIFRMDDRAESFVHCDTKGGLIKPGGGGFGGESYFQKGEFMQCNLCGA
eukprot:9501618-Pyramimonas_sp.AAC.1